MSINLPRLLENIQQLKNGKTLPFHLSCVTSCGTPELWNEEIAYEYQGEQHYSTIRSNADAGGAAIGQWAGKASSELFNELINAFEACQFWSLAPEPVLPGGELISWSFRIGEENETDTFTLYFRSESPLLTKLQTLDTLMRRIPYWLKQEQSAANISCATQIIKSHAFISLKNNGAETCVIPNPLATSWNDETYLKIEIAKPEDPNNPTGLGLVYKPLDLIFPEKMDEKWQKDILILGAQKQLTFPFSALITDEFKSYYLRSVYSDYRTPDSLSDTINTDISSNIKLYGRAFSLEEKI